MRRAGRVLVAAALLVVATACDSRESPGRSPAGPDASVRASAASPTLERRPVSRRLGEAYRYEDRSVDATVTVDRFRETTPPPGDLIAVTVVVEMRGGTWDFGPDLVRFSYDGADRGTGTVLSGPSGSVALGSGMSTRWALRFAAPARTSGAKVTVFARPTLPLAEWPL